MMRLVSARLFRIAVVSFAAFVALPGASARAATLPANAEVHAGQCVAATTFRQLVSARYQVEFQQVVATDIDRDGDIDVLATTDRSFTVWINDGAGHLTSSRTASGPSIERQPWSNVLGGHDATAATAGQHRCANDGGPDRPCACAAGARDHSRRSTSSLGRIVLPHQFQRSSRSAARLVPQPF